MITAKCICGAVHQVPQSFIGEPLPCEKCKQPVTLIAREGAMDQPAIRLIVTEGPGRRGEQFLIGGDGPIEIGKLDGKHIQLPGEQISRTHCRLSKTDMGWVIQDANSKNGLWINCQRVNAHVLADGDVINAGEFQLIFNRLAGDVAPSVEEIEPELELLEEAEDVDTLELLPDEPAGAADPEDALTFAAAVEATAPRAATPTIPIDDDILEIKEEPVVRPKRSAGPPLATAVPMDGPTCPSCQKRLGRNAKICVACGIDVKSGRSLITAKGFDENDLAISADTWIRLVSILVPFGLYPVASEAFGTRKPYAIWGTAILTAIVSLYFAIAINGNGGWSANKNLMLWVGDPSKHRIDEISADIDKRFDAIAAKYHEKPDSARMARIKEDVKQRLAHDEALAEPGEFRWYQTLTAAFLHDHSNWYHFLMHIGGNTLFLLVLGSGVNAAIGNAKTAVIYPLLAIAASVAEIIAYASGAPMPCLGASGAVMGLAGMYLVLFPIHRVHMAIWLRAGIFTGWRCAYKVWAVRGFWVVLFFIAFDVVATLTGAKDGVGHWAHLGGFIAGMMVALVLLLTRMVDARGGDILTAMLGRRAWALLGRPADHVAPAV
jgi:membrane associated rhomboid family serine protease/pSer/pThr/pTyr-binding forkhead associated (FHA) protein